MTLDQASFNTLANTPKVDSVTIAASEIPKIAQDLSIFHLFIEADLVVQFIMLMLLLCSIWCWAIIIDKWLYFARLKRQIKNFEKEFWSGKPLDVLLKQAKRDNDTNPLAQILIAALEEWSIFDVKTSQDIYDSIKARLQNVIQLATSKALSKIENQVLFLATSASSTPFIGLFGTVWGIMSSFQSIAASKNTSLAVVAPGIAEALMATAIGLLVAIPAGIFYNKFIADINNFTVKAEDFGIEMHTLLSRELDNFKKNTK